MNIRPTPSRRPFAAVQVEPGAYEVSVNVPRINDEAHPQASDSMNRHVMERVVRAQTDAEPPPGCKGSLEAGGTVKQTGPLVSVTVSLNSYSGGAHPNTELQTFLYDAEHGREVKLDDLFADRQKFLPAVAKMAAERLGKNPDVDATFVEMQTAPRADNFAAFEPDDEGITFMFPAARMGPYNAGLFDAKIKWDEMRSALDPEGPMWRASAPFAWEHMDAPQAEESRRVFEQLLALRNPVYDRLDPRGSEGARDAATDFMLISARSGDRPVLADQFVRLYNALATRKASAKTRELFSYIEDGLADGRFHTTDRVEVTVRVLTALAGGATVDETRQILTRPPADNHLPPVVERQAQSVKINGVRVPINPHKS